MTDLDQRASFATRRQYLDVLADRLSTFDREISLTRTGVPMLVVTNPEEPTMSDQVLCCHDIDGTLAYFWPWGQRIAGVGNPEGAALDVARVLGT